MVRKRDVKDVKSDIDRLEKDIAFGKLEIKNQLDKMGMAEMNIDHIESELADEKNDFEEAKQMVIDCRKQMKEDNATLVLLKKKILMMNGDNDMEYVRPCDKQRHVSETTLTMHRC